MFCHKTNVIFRKHNTSYTSLVLFLSMYFMCPTLSVKHHMRQSEVCLHILVKLFNIEIWEECRDFSCSRAFGI